MSLEQAEAHQKKHGFKPLTQAFVEMAEMPKKSKLRAEAPKMNQTEREFSMMLEAQKQKGEIVRYVFEGITLLWGGSMHYKPDFFMLTHSLNWRCIEVKGAKIWDRDTVRFKGCRAEWPEFEFQFWQKKESTWNQLL
jgi:hypothetical protein